MKRQTTANNAILADAKKAMNAKVFKKVSEIMNQDGEDAALAYLQSFFSAPVREALARLAAEVDRIRADQAHNDRSGT